MQIRMFLIIAIIGVSGFCLGSWAQDDAAKGGAEMMPPWLKQTKEHEALSKSCGQFTVDGEFWMAPGQPATKMPATATRKMIMNGYFLQEDFKAKFMGTDFEGRLIHGYDTVTKEHVSVWIDNTSPFITINRGTRADGVLTTTTRDVNRMTGQMKDAKSVVKTDDMGQIEYASYDTPKDGKEQMTMRLKYKRAAQGSK